MAMPPRIIPCKKYSPAFYRRASPPENPTHDPQAAAEVPPRPCQQFSCGPPPPELGTLPGTNRDLQVQAFPSPARSKDQTHQDLQSGKRASSNRQALARSTASTARAQYPSPNKSWCAISGWPSLPLPKSSESPPAPRDTPP